MKAFKIIILSFVITSHVNAQTVKKVNPLVYCINKESRPTYQVSLGYNLLQGTNLEGYMSLNNGLGLFTSVGFADLKMSEEASITSASGNITQQRSTLISAGISKTRKLNTENQIFEWQIGLSAGQYFYQENPSILNNENGGIRWSVSEQTVFTSIQMHWLKEYGDFYAGIRADISQNPTLKATSFLYGGERDLSGNISPSVGPILGYQYAKNRITWGFQAGLNFRRVEYFSYTYESETLFSTGAQNIQGITGTFQFKVGYLIKQ